MEAINSIDARFCGRLALISNARSSIRTAISNWLCSCSKNTKAEWEKVNPSPPTFMGENRCRQNASAAAGNEGETQCTKLTHNGQPVGKAHPHRITCYIEALERGLVGGAGHGLMIERIAGSRANERYLNRRAPDKAPCFRLPRQGRTGSSIHTSGVITAEQHRAIALILQGKPATYEGEPSRMSRVRLKYTHKTLDYYFSVYIIQLMDSAQRATGALAESGLE